MSALTDRRLALFLSCAALALPVAGCGDDDESTDTGAGGGAAPTTESDSTPTDTGGGTDSVKVGMKDIQYVPKDVTVKKGGTVLWTNSDTVTHTVTKESGPGAEFDSGNLDVDATFEQKFTAPGKINYVCQIHPNQTGTVTVK